MCLTFSLSLSLSVSLSLSRCCCCSKNATKPKTTGRLRVVLPPSFSRWWWWWWWWSRFKRSSSSTKIVYHQFFVDESHSKTKGERIQNEERQMGGINRANDDANERRGGVTHHQSVQLGIAPGGATWTGENRSGETEKVLARGVRSIRVVLRVLEIWSVTVGNETDERCKDFTKQIGKRRAGNVRGITRHRRTRNDCIRDELRGELARFYRSHGQGSISETTFNDAGKNARFHRRGRVGAERKVFGAIRNRQFRRAKLRDGEVGDDRRWTHPRTRHRHDH